MTLPKLYFWRVSRDVEYKLSWNVKPVYDTVQYKIEVLIDGDIQDQSEEPRIEEHIGPSISNVAKAFNKLEMSLDPDKEHIGGVILYVITTEGEAVEIYNSNVGATELTLQNFGKEISLFQNLTGF